MNIIQEKLSSFIHHSLDSQQKRQQVWDVWMCFRDIKPCIRNIQRIINQNSIPVHLFFGKYDRIIPPSIGKKFLQGLKNKNCLHIVEMGHEMLKERMNEYLIEAISRPQSTVDR